ncbi:hypothetical protein ANN_26090 [Periplaneta americana]|uniref:Uncharacterized protein n=1 Tax=Periplaneta americana TaxID=6978 RepID=A0ABQ8S4Z8_PERAM|nr:hypothetical protein ANN_26090 [Periplaneta americana]
MAGLCEGGNEPSGSLKAICNVDLYETGLAPRMSRFLNSQPLEDLMERFQFHCTTLITVWDLDSNISAT